MDISAAITWIFANHELVLYGVGGLTVVLIAFSVWGLLRSLLRGGSNRARRREARKALNAATEAASLDDLAEPEEELVEADMSPGMRQDDFRAHPVAEDPFAEPFLDDAAADTPTLAEAAEEPVFADDPFADDGLEEPAFAGAPDVAAAEEVDDTFADFDDDLGDLDAFDEPEAPAPEAPAMEPVEAASDFDEAEMSDDAFFDSLDDAEPEPMAAESGYNPCMAAPAAPAPPMPATAPTPLSSPTQPAAAGATQVPETDDVRVLAESIFEANFPRLHPAAYAEARENVAVFAAMLSDAAQVKLSLDERQRFAGADVEILLNQIVQHAARRRDEEKYAVMISLLIGRVMHDDKDDIVDLLDQAIDVVLSINSVDHLKIVIMCLYLRSINLRSNEVSELENIVKYATNFGQGSNFSNIRTGTLFSRGLLMYNAGMDRVEGQIVRNHGPLLEVDPGMLENFPGENPDMRQLVYERLNLSAEQSSILDQLGQSQCGRATATGIGWATAAAYIEAHTGQPADWERMVR